MTGAVLVASVWMSTLQAADIQGNVVIERALTKRNVTLSAGLYQRGAPVPLGADEEEDPLAYERSHVVVYIEGAFASKPVAAVIEQRDRRFTPDLVVIPAGSHVSFPNFDPIFHNVFSLSKPKNFDLGNYPKGDTRTVTFGKPGVVSVFCHLHPNMAATVFVTPNQWGARADGSGVFTLSGVPPGEYTVVAWHKTGGTFRQKIQLSAQGATLDFFIPLPAEEEKHH